MSTNDPEQLDMFCPKVGEFLKDHRCTCGARQDLRDVRESLAWPTEETDQQ